MSKNIKKIVKKNLNTLLETKGFEEMEVAFGVKEKSDNLSKAEKNQFGGLETIQDKESGLINLGDASVQPALNKVNKETKKDADDYYKEVAKKMVGFQETPEAEPSQIGEAFNPPKVNREDDQTEPDDVYSTEALGPGMLALRYDNEGTPVHKKFQERMEDMNGDDLTYKKLKAYSEKYLKHKYKSPDEYHYSPKIRETEDPINEGTQPLKEGILMTLGGIALGAYAAKKAYDYISNALLKRRMEETGEVKKGKNGITMKQYKDKNSGELFWGVWVVDQANADPGYRDSNILLFKDDPERIEKILNSEIKWDFSDESRMSDDHLDRMGQFVADKRMKMNYESNSTHETYMDVLKENIFKVKGQIKSKEQIIKLVDRLPERVKIDETVFAVTDGENYYRLIWEGMGDGEAVITHEKNVNIVNESINKMKHLWDFKSSENLNKKPSVKENDDIFFKMMNQVRGK